jgi:pimeloyl-ACP methyl ester carboxylesterase
MMGSRFFLEQRDLPGYESITLDFRGHGRSKKTDTGHTVPTYAADVEAFLNAQNLDEVVLVGCSMGALVGWEYIEQFGTDRLAGFVVVDQQPMDLEREGYEHGVFDFDELTDLMALAQHDHDDLAIVDVPTLVCAGEDDTLLDPAGVVYVAEHTPDTTVERFERSSHCPFLEEPDRFNDVLTTFVEGCW